MRRGERGFSLIETLVTVAIVGITFAVFVGGMGTAIIGSDNHRKQAVVQAGIRNFAEAVKAVRFDTNCSTAATTYLNAYSAPVTQENAASVATNATSHVAPSLQADAGSVLLTFFGLAGGTTLTPPVGTTELWDRASSGELASARVTSEAASRTVDSAGPTGERAAISIAPADSVSRSVLLASARPGPVRRGATSASNAGAASLTLLKPVETMAGDVMIAHIVVRGSDAVIGPPAGWTVIASAASGANVRTATYQRVATTAGTPSYVWSVTPSREAAGGIVSFGGVQQGFTASIPSVKWWNGSSFTSTCPAAEAQSMQLVTLRLVSNDNASSQTVDIVKRCGVKPTANSVCGDA